MFFHSKIYFTIYSEHDTSKQKYQFREINYVITGNQQSFYIGTKCQDLTMVWR